MEITTKLRLPLLQPGQAQKELFHNEALQILDVIVAAVVEEPPRDEPPATPVAGSCYIVGGAPIGDWSGKAGQLAAFTEAGWRYVAPDHGLSVHVRSTGTIANYRGGDWNPGAAILDPAGGIQVDAEARAAISAILAALRDRGLIA